MQSFCVTEVSWDCSSRSEYLGDFKFGIWTVGGKVCNPVLLLDQYPYLDLHETDGLFISTFLKEKTVKNEKWQKWQKKP